MLISAFAIHTGGGAVLLHEILPAADGAGQLLLLDARFAGKPAQAKVIRIAPTVASRVLALVRISRWAEGHDVVVCLNGLPPLRRAPARTIGYLHAVYFERVPAGVAYPVAVRMRFAFERLLFRLGRRNLDEIWVQTEAMARAAERIARGVPVRIVPFVPAALAAALAHPPAPRATGADFFYPADDAGHKNHARLLKAWVLLAREGLRPPLVLTLTPGEYAGALTRARIDTEALPHVAAIGRISRAEVEARLGTCRALIFPSLAETYGLPLMEAAAAGAPILAAERDFVRDVCVPAETFDPESAVSIVRAVRRLLGVEPPSPIPLDGAGFIAAVKAAGKR